MRLENQLNSILNLVENDLDRRGNSEGQNTRNKGQG